jgi:threonine aldolase
MGSEPETNILIFHVSQSWGTAQQYAAALEEHGVQAMAVSSSAIRMVTHLDVSSEQIEQVCKVIERIGNNPKH